MALRRVCHGWRALYEVWSIKTNKRTVTLEVSLEPADLADSLLYLWLCDGHENEGHMQLPLAISPDVSAFTVARTLFVLHRAAGTSTVRCLRTVLPTPSRTSIESEFLWRGAPRTNWTEAGSACRLRNALFCPNEQFIALQEEDEFDCRQLRVAQYAIIGQGLSAKIVGSIQVSGVEQLSFHPALPLLAFYSGCRHWTYCGRKAEANKNGVRVWPFLKGSLPRPYPLRSILLLFSLYRLLIRLHH